MDLAINITHESIYTFLQNVNYGTNFVTYCDTTCRRSFLECLKLINDIYGAGTIEEVPYSFSDESAEETEYNILCRVKNPGFNRMTENDYFVELDLRNALREKSIVEVTLIDDVAKYASKIAKKAGIKFISYADGRQCFNGALASTSVSKQIQDAYSAGLESISFDVSQVNSATVRCYTSNLGKVFSKKFRCEVMNGKITVHFKEISRSADLYSKFSKLRDEYLEEIGSFEFMEQFKKMYNETISPITPDWSELPKAEFYEPDTEEDFNQEYRKPFNSEEWHLADGKNTPLREFDGFQQYYMEELEKEAEQSEKEFLESRPSLEVPYIKAKPLDEWDEEDNDF